jgi:hypothetical protein
VSLHSIDGDGLGDGKRRGNLSAVPPPNPPRTCCAATSPIIEVRVHSDTAATSMPLAPPEPPPSPKLGRDPLRDFIHELNKPKRYR